MIDSEIFQCLRIQTFWVGCRDHGRHFLWIPLILFCFKHNCSLLLVLAFPPDIRSPPLGHHHYISHNIWSISITYRFQYFETLAERQVYSIRCRCMLRWMPLVLWSWDGLIPSHGALLILQNGMWTFLLKNGCFQGWFHHPQIAPVPGPWNIWRFGRVRFMCMFIDFSRENHWGTNKTWWRRWALLGSFDFIGGLTLSVHPTRLSIDWSLKLLFLCVRITMLMISLIWLALRNEGRSPHHNQV